MRYIMTEFQWTFVPDFVLCDKQDTFIYLALIRAYLHANGLSLLLKWITCLECTQEII